MHYRLIQLQLQQLRINCSELHYTDTMNHLKTMTGRQEWEVKITHATNCPFHNLVRNEQAASVFFFLFSFSSCFHPHRLLPHGHQKKKKKSQLFCPPFPASVSQNVCFLKFLSDLVESRCLSHHCSWHFFFIPPPHPLFF